MPIVGCAILPHGSMVLDPAREGLPDGVAEITNGCRAVGECVAAWEPELVVLLTPHGLSASKSPRPGIYMTPSATGTAEWKDQYKEYEMSIRIDVEAAQNFLHHLGTYGVACVKITGTEAPLFRSEIVPLWFLRTLATLRRPPKFLIVSLPTPVGGTSVIRSAVSKDRIEDNLQFGQHLHRFLQYNHQKVAVVLSGDLAHTHATNCTSELYLPDPTWKLPVSDAAAVFDAMVEKWAQTLNRDFLTKDAAALVAKAISCGFDGFVVLQGLMEREGTRNFESHIFARHRPSYFGMMAAVFPVPKRSEHRKSLLGKRLSMPILSPFSADRENSDAFELFGRNRMS